MGVWSGECGAVGVGVEGEAWRAVTMAKSKAKQLPRPAPPRASTLPARRRWKPCRETSRQVLRGTPGLPGPPSVLS